MLAVTDMEEATRFASTGRACSPPCALNAWLIMPAMELRTKTLSGWAQGQELRLHAEAQAASSCPPLLVNPAGRWREVGTPSTGPPDGHQNGPFTNRAPRADQPERRPELEQAHAHWRPQRVHHHHQRRLPADPG
jgi:hypothetical protein